MMAEVRFGPVTHVAGLFGYPCHRSVPLLSRDRSLAVAALLHFQVAENYRTSVIVSVRKPSMRRIVPYFSVSLSESTPASM